MKTRNDITFKFVAIACGLFLTQTIANACSASQGAVADNARSLGINYINLAIQYAELTNNTYYKGVAATAWQNQLSWRAVYNAATNRAECFKATIDLQHWTAQMNQNYANLASYIAAIQQQAASSAASSSVSSATSSTSSASSTSSTSSISSVASSTSSTTSDTEIDTDDDSESSSEDDVDSLEAKDNRILLIEKI